MNKPSDANGAKEPLHEQDKPESTRQSQADPVADKATDGDRQQTQSSQAVDAPEQADEEVVSVVQLQEEIQRKNDEIMRLNAEMDNIRKRNARELENLRKYALDKFTKELLPVVDSMEKAMQVDRDNTTVDQVLEGTELTQKILHKVLQSHGLEVIDPKGEKFDPEQHEAVSAVPSESEQPNTVLDVFQKGYKLNGRVVRPAMVVVSK